MAIGISGVEKTGTEEIVAAIKHRYVQRPVQTLFTIFGLLIGFASLILSIYYLYNQQINKIEKGNVGIQERLQELNDVQFSLKELAQFIESQKQSIVNLNNLLESLKEEKSELEPIIQANRELLDKIFKQQEKRSKWEFRVTIILTFLFGIVTSFFGSILYRFYKKNKVKNAST